MNASRHRDSPAGDGEASAPLPDATLSLGESIAERLAALERELGPGAQRTVVSGLRRDFAELARALGEAAELSSLSAYLQVTSEHEKAALARELHDQLGGILTPARMDLSWLQARLGGEPEFRERMERLGALIDQGIDLKRRIIENLHPSLLDHLGLASALQWHVDEVSRKAGIEPHLHIDKHLERLPADLEIALFRLVQEGVANVVKHSRAAHVSVTVERTAQGLHMTVSDDGVGIVDLEAARRLSHGLAGMSHRVHSLEGTFKVHSLPGKGTRIEIFAPLAQPAAKPA